MQFNPLLLQFLVPNNLPQYILKNNIQPPLTQMLQAIFAKLAISHVKLAFIQVDQAIAAAVAVEIS